MSMGDLFTVNLIVLSVCSHMISCWYHIAVHTYSYSTAVFLLQKPKKKTNKKHTHTKQNKTKKTNKQTKKTGLKSSQLDWSDIEPKITTPL